MTKKKPFFRGTIGSSLIIYTGTRYGVAILCKGRKNDENENHKVFGTNLFVFRSYNVVKEK